ncbi:MAG: ABC transporter ATP-binding protein [Candidatus Caldarchaeum sp.]|nr:ABC transporter ATP-binding protein [Candidatus Caldarchaeum sp.]
MGEAEYLVEMSDIVKRFPNVLANDKASFRLKRGEVHALLGENAAGKSTLMNVLYGLYRPDSGEIKIDGKRVEIKSPRDALKLGIGMVHQQFKLIPVHTVAENVILGLKELGFLINYRRVNRELEELIKSYGWKISPESKVWQLSAGEKQQVELLKALYRKARILILDEPTSVLTPQETVVLFQTLRKMASQGLGIVLITHKLDEVMSVSDRVTVMRAGKTVATKEVRETNTEELVELMIGRPLMKLSAEKKKVSEKPVLQASNLVVLNDKGLEAVRNVSFNLYGGEILGIAGVSGNGQQELLEAMAGLRRVVSGKITLNGVDITNKHPFEIIKLGVSYIPAEALRYSAPDMTVEENLIMKVYRNPEFSNGFLINWRNVEQKSADLVKAFKIVTPSTKNRVGNLSGGNVQRLVLARELGTNSNLRVILAAYPTRGLDIASTEAIHQELIKQSEKGVSILLVSEELEELITLSDRIMVMYRGIVVGVLQKDEFDIEKIGMMMTGLVKQEVSA